MAHEYAAAAIYFPCHMVAAFRYYNAQTPQKLLAEGAIVFRRYMGDIFALANMHAAAFLARAAACLSAAVEIYYCFFCFAVRTAIL